MYIVRLTQNCYYQSLGFMLYNMVEANRATRLTLTEAKKAIHFLEQMDWTCVLENAEVGG